MPYSTNGKRDYKKEKAFQAREEQKDNRAARNAARAEAMKEGKVSKGDGKEVDHVVPLSKGGGEGKGNTRVMSKKANRQKSKR